MLSDTVVLEVICKVERCVITATQIVPQEDYFLVDVSILRNEFPVVKHFKIPSTALPILHLVTSQGRGLVLTEDKPSPKRNWSEILIYESVEWLS